LPELQKKLESSQEGLSQAEAQLRLAQYGPNEIEEKRTNPFLKFLTYFWGPIPWMIEVAVILSALVRHWPDFFIILVLLVANAAVGFWQSALVFDAMDNGPRCRRVSWCPATSSACVLATSCLRMHACGRGIRWKWTNPP
jgi:hypothetical protein